MMSKENSAPRIGLIEGIIVLIGMLIVMGVSVIKI